MLTATHQIHVLRAVVLVAVLAIIGLSIGLARSHGHGSGALQLVNCSSNATTYPLQFFVVSRP